VSDHDDYTDGDVNRIDDTEDRAATAIAVLEFCARQLADEPDAVEVSTRKVGSKVILDLRVSPDDMGRVIGRRGRTAQALRTVVGAAGARDGVVTSVDILD
jgi:predicted RNA-binding protein YlqC (UPF0109 family)